MSAIGHAHVTTQTKARTRLEAHYDAEVLLTRVQLTPAPGYEDRSTVGIELHLAAHQLSDLIDDLSSALDAALDDPSAIGLEMLYQRQALPPRLAHVERLDVSA